MNKIQAVAVAALLALLCATPAQAAGRNHGEDELVHGDSWHGMAVVTQGERFYQLMTELRADAPATRDWTYDPRADNCNSFLPQLENLYSRITFR